MASNRGNMGGMVGVDLEVLRAELAAVPVAAAISDLAKQEFVMVNEAAADLFGMSIAEAVGSGQFDHIHPDDRPAAEAGAASLASGVVDGYQATRHIVRPDGTEVSISIWGRRIDAPGGPFGLWILLPDPPSRIDPGCQEAEIVLAVTDHDWQIAYASADAKVLGITASDLTGRPLLGFIHPTAAADFLAAAGRAITSRMAVTVRTRLRVEHGWADRFVLIVPMCEHEPPRLGVAVTAASPADPETFERIGHHVLHASVDARARDALQAMPALKRNGAPELSPRQVEVLARVVAGDEVDEIARALFISPSTVRNHLTVIYRKFGVHSRAALLAMLLRPAD